MLRPCDQNAPRKIGDASRAGYTRGKAVQRSIKDQVSSDELSGRVSTYQLEGQVFGPRPLSHSQ